MELPLAGSGAYLKCKLYLFHLTSEVYSLPARPKPIHCVVRSRMIDGRVDIGILKYRSMIARISVAYAELAPEVNITLTVSL